MKILSVVHKLSKGGTERAAQVFVEAYRALGNDSRILALHELGPRNDELKGRLKIWHRLSDENLNQIIKWTPDIIHIHSHGPKKEDIIKLITSFADKPKVIETNVFSRPSLWADQIDISLQLSHWAQWLYNMRGGRKNHSAIIPYPVNCPNFKRAEKAEIANFKRRYGIPENAAVIGRIGQFFPLKWSPLLIKIFEELATHHKDLHRGFKKNFRIMSH